MGALTTWFQPRSGGNETAIDCPLTGSFSCEDGNRYPPCKNPKGLDFNTTQIIFRLTNCTSDLRVYKEDGVPDPNGLPGRLGCEAVAGSGMTIYPGSDIWTRLTTWKLPLLQLVFLTPRPPLGYMVEAFVISRLLGNPIGTLQHLIVKVASCQSRAVTWKSHFSRGGSLETLVVAPTLPIEAASFTAQDEGQATDQSTAQNTAQMAGARSELRARPNRTGTSSLLKPQDSQQGAEPSNRSQSSERNLLEGNPEESERTQIQEQDYKLQLRIFQRRERLWKAFALIIDSYDEWGISEGDMVQTLLFDRLEKMRLGGLDRKLDSRTERFLEICLLSAEALAADRATKFLPISAAQVIFIASTAISLFRTLAAGAYAPGFYLNIEAYSIAFTATYFWIISIVFISSVIGSSQSEERIPRILNRFRQELLREAKAPPTNNFQEMTHEMAIRLPQHYVLEPDLRDTDSSPPRGGTNEALIGSRDSGSMAMSSRMQGRRKYDGGIYSWQPAKFLSESIDLEKIKVALNVEGTERQTIEGRPADSSTWRKLSHAAIEFVTLVKNFVAAILWAIFAIVPGSPWFPWMAVASVTMTGCITAWKVPPKGFECRHVCLILMLFFWTLNWTLDGIRFEDRQRLFFFNYTKDTVCTILTFLLIILTQVGFLNRCDCYTLWGKVAFPLPQFPPAAELLLRGFRLYYPALAVSGILFHLIVIPSAISLQYFHAFQIFLQRDDGATNWLWFQELRFKYEHGGMLKATNMLLCGVFHLLLFLLRILLWELWRPIISALHGLWTALKKLPALPSLIRNLPTSLTTMLMETRSIARTKWTRFEPGQSWTALMEYCWAFLEYCSNKPSKSKLAPHEAGFVSAPVSKQGREQRTNPPRADTFPR